MARILLVEDEIPLAMVTKLLIENLGHKVFVANDVDTALKLLTENTPEIVLLDIMIPEKDGWQMLEEARQKGLIQNSKWILFTARDFDKNKELLKYIHAILKKPCEKQEIEEAISTALKN